MLEKIIEILAIMILGFCLFILVSVYVEKRTQKECAEPKYLHVFVEYV